MIKKPTIVFLLAFFSSCETVQHVRGVVVDADSQMPIEDVVVYQILPSKDSALLNHTSDKECHPSETLSYVSDSHGRFNFMHVTGSFTYRCPTLTLCFEKEGYLPVMMTYESCSTDSTIVFLKRQNVDVDIVQ